MLVNDKNVENEWKSFHLFSYSISSFCTSAVFFVAVRLLCSSAVFHSASFCQVPAVWQMQISFFNFFVKLWQASAVFAFALTGRWETLEQCQSRDSYRSLFKQNGEQICRDVAVFFQSWTWTNCIAAVGFIKWESSLKNQTGLCQQ